MKTLACLCTLAAVLAVPSLHADSKRTAEYLLSSPSEFEGKQVTLDVAMVQPVKWKSPLPEVAFFHAMTLDRVDHKPGGAILVAVPSAESAAFARKYGTDFEGRADSDPLKGAFIASGPRRVWVIDMTGRLPQLLAERKATLPDQIGGRLAETGGPGWRRGPRQP